MKEVDLVLEDKFFKKIVFSIHHSPEGIQYWSDTAVSYDHKTQCIVRIELRELCNSISKLDENINNNLFI